MNTQYNIKNFRVFDENGVDLTLAPITILTGCKSSGKSSVVKSLLLLDTFLSDVKSAIENDKKIDLSNYRLDFTKSPNNMLGRFDKVIHKPSNSKSVTFEYLIYSLMLSENVLVRLTFAANIADELNNGYLQSMKVLCKNEVIFSTEKDKGNFYNFEFIKSEA